MQLFKWNRHIIFFDVLGSKELIHVEQLFVIPFKKIFYWLRIKEINRVFSFLLLKFTIWPCLINILLDLIFQPFGIFLFNSSQFLLLCDNFITSFICISKGFSMFCLLLGQKLLPNFLIKLSSNLCLFCFLFLFLSKFIHLSLLGLISFSFLFLSFLLECPHFFLFSLFPLLFLLLIN
jgi:hypothetical protein